jgi:hypothetical protein
MTEARSQLRSQRLRLVNHQGDARPRYQSGILSLYSRVARGASPGASLTRP